MDCATCGRLVALVTAILILTIGACWIHADYRIAKAIERGNDPVLARLAFSSPRDEPARFLYIANKEK